MVRTSAIRRSLSRVWSWVTSRGSEVRSRPKFISDHGCSATFACLRSYKIQSIIIAFLRLASGLFGETRMFRLAAKEALKHGSGIRAIRNDFIGGQWPLSACLCPRAFLPASSAREAWQRAVSFKHTAQDVIERCVINQHPLTPKMRAASRSGAAASGHPPFQSPVSLPPQAHDPAPSAAAPDHPGRSVDANPPAAPPASRDD